MKSFPGKNLVPEPTSKNQTAARVRSWTSQVCQVHHRHHDHHQHHDHDHNHHDCRFASAPLMPRPFGIPPSLLPGMLQGFAMPPSTMASLFQRWSMLIIKIFSKTTIKTKIIIPPSTMTSLFQRRGGRLECPPWWSLGMMSRVSTRWFVPRFTLREKKRSPKRVNWEIKSQKICLWYFQYQITCRPRKEI